MCEGEAIPQCMGSLNIGADTKFKLGPWTMVFQTIAITDQKKVDLTEPDIRRLSQAIETQLKHEVEEMIAEAEMITS